MQVYERMFADYGQQHWWPGNSPFEVMVGAILTQNTAWTNVEKAITQLIAADCLDARRILDVEAAELAQWIRPSGYFNIKATRLRNFCRWYLEQGGYESLSTWETMRLRTGLLSVNGIGPETADDMLLYAFERPIFVVDSYTKRLFSRLGLMAPDSTYHQVQQLFHEELVQDLTLFNEYHALIVLHCKDYCRTRPLCEGCVLAEVCPREGVAC